MLLGEHFCVRHTSLSVGILRGFLSRKCKKEEQTVTNLFLILFASSFFGVRFFAKKPLQNIGSIYPLSHKKLNIHKIIKKYSCIYHCDMVK